MVYKVTYLVNKIIFTYAGVEGAGGDDESVQDSLGSEQAPFQFYTPFISVTDATSI